MQVPKIAATPVVTSTAPIPVATVPVLPAVVGASASAALYLAASTAHFLGGSAISRDFKDLAEKILTKTQPNVFDWLAHTLDPLGLGLSEYFKKAALQQRDTGKPASQKTANENAKIVATQKSASSTPTLPASALENGSGITLMTTGTLPDTEPLSTVALTNVSVVTTQLSAAGSEERHSLDAVRAQTSANPNIAWPKVDASLSSANLIVTPASIGWATVAGGHPGFFSHLFNQISFDGDAELKAFLTGYSRETEPVVKLVRRAVADVFSHYCSFYRTTPGAMGAETSLELKRTERGFEIRLQGRSQSSASAFPNLQNLNIDESDSAFDRFPRRLEGSLALFPLGAKLEKRSDTEGVFLAFVPIPAAYLRSERIEAPYSSSVLEHRGTTGRATPRVSNDNHRDRDQGQGRGQNSPNSQDQSSSQDNLPDTNSDEAAA